MFCGPWKRGILRILHGCAEYPAEAGGQGAFSGSQFDLIKGFWIKETEGVPIEKETAAKRRASGVYTRLVDAGKMLMDVIHRNEGGANKDLTRFTEQILSLCDKWDR